MDDWSISRHSYVRPRLLGQVKEEFVHSNLCSEHSFLSPSYDILKKNKVISNQNHVKMKELRESLRQAALINIVAAVNDGDVDDISSKDKLNGNQSDFTGTLCDQSNQQIHQRLTDKSNANETPKLQSAQRPVGYLERQKLCPKMKLSDSLSVNYSKRELSILEGHQLITSPPLQELTSNNVAKKRKKKLKPKLDSNQGDTLVVVKAVKETATFKSIGQKKQVSCSNLVVNDFGIIENTYRSENIMNFERDQEIDAFSMGLGLQKMSEVTSDRKFESESESVSSKDSKNSQKCVLHISTKDGEIGRSAGFFPPPGFKRETPTLKRESKPSKCDAVDILESSSPAVIEKSVFISSQRDNFGELGNCLFGLKKSSSLPAVPTSVKRKKLKPKTDKELIMLANPLGKSLSDKPIQLDDGVVGTNIRNDSNRGNIDNHTPTLNRHLIKPSVSHIIIPTDLSISSIYHLAEERLETPRACRDITLEGHGLPSVNFREKKVLPVQPNKIDLWTHRDETKHHLSNQIYDFQGLPLDRSPDDRQTIQDIQPIVRKAGVIPNASPVVYNTPRPRPINASMSTIKHVDEQIRPSNGKVVEQDLCSSDLDLAIHASKLEDCASTRGPSEGESHGDKQYMISKSRSSGYKGSISNLSDDEISKDKDDLYDSDASSDVDITKIDPPQTPIMRKVTSCASAKHQGTSSMSTNKDKLTKLHVINNTDIGKETTVKILKSYDQELYADFTHRKHRNSHFTKSGDDELKVIHVKVRCTNKEPAEPNQTLDDHSDASDSD